MGEKKLGDIKTRNLYTKQKLIVLRVQWYPFRWGFIDNYDTQRLLTGLTNFANKLAICKTWPLNFANILAIGSEWVKAPGPSHHAPPRTGLDYRQWAAAVDPRGRGGANFFSLGCRPCFWTATGTGPSTYTWKNDNRYRYFANIASSSLSTSIVDPFIPFALNSKSSLVYI